MKALHYAAIIVALFDSSPTLADEIHVAVAANFAAPLKSIATDFEKDTGNKLVIAADATGKLYAQIKNGAPFELFLSADQATPSRLAQEGDAVANSQFTYARGKLVLWSSKPNFVDAKGDVLKSGYFTHIAIANPKSAPYGAAAMEVVKQLNLIDQLTTKWVQGENIAQTFQFVSSGNAELGFVAFSQVSKAGKITEGSAWIVDASLYSPIKQDLIVLNKGKNSKAADSFLHYLQNAKTKATIRNFGYDI